MEHWNKTQVLPVLQNYRTNPFGFGAAMSGCAAEQFFAAQVQALPAQTNPFGNIGKIVRYIAY